MVPFSLNGYTCIHAFCVHEPLWLRQEDHCWSFAIPRSPQQSFQLSVSGGPWIDKRLVGLGRFELDHPALRCLFFLFCFVFYFKRIPNLAWTCKPFDLIWFRHSYFSVNPFYPSSSSMLMTLLASFPRLGTIPIEEHQHDNIILWNTVSGICRVQSAKPPIRFFSPCSSLLLHWSFACLSAECDLFPLCVVNA